MFFLVSFLFLDNLILVWVVPEKVLLKVSYPGTYIIEKLCTRKKIKIELH